VIPELGQFALVLALGLALIQASLPLLGAAQGRDEWIALARPMAAGQFVFVAAAFLVLTHAFTIDDFSVRYVAMHSNTALPFAYKVAAVWGGHEGSLLLWMLILAGWTLAVAAASRSLPDAFAARVIGVLGIVSVGILSFMLLTSNPFDRLLPAAVDGNDLNPLLQDPAFAIHPPMLYLGYVGFSVPFAFAVAALLTGMLDKRWARWTRPWTLGAWLFQTLGIALGSWWAYYELGWGGWWFWDPVENASFMPWLAGTALIHSLAVTERRGIFKSWTILLAILAFSLSLLGTFIVRSGLLTSVHAFASDPERGLFILMLLMLITGGALTLYAMRAGRMEAEGGFKLVSREAFLLLNNVLLVVATGLVLIGTLYPMFLDAAGFGTVSVGPPYFNTTFSIPMLPLVLLLGLGMHASWLGMRGETLVRKLMPAAIIAVLGGIVSTVVISRGVENVLTPIGIIAGLWVVIASFWDPIMRLVRRESHAVGITRAKWGMIVAHAGVGLFVLGVTVTSAFTIESDQAMAPGDSASIAGFDFEFRGVREVEGANYDAYEADVAVRRNGSPVTLLAPQKRVYRVQKNPMTEAAIDPGLRRDLFVALGEPLGGDAWSVRIQYRPMLRFVWLGTLLMALGGLLAATDRRYRAEQPQAAGVTPGRLVENTETA
jgi:cytochrome c-type biogenesis protein CcmF